MCGSENPRNFSWKYRNHNIFERNLIKFSKNVDGVIFQLNKNLKIAKLHDFSWEKQCSCDGGSAVDHKTCIRDGREQCASCNDSKIPVSMKDGTSPCTEIPEWHWTIFAEPKIHHSRNFFSYHLVECGPTNPIYFRIVPMFRLPPYSVASCAYTTLARILIVENISTAWTTLRLRITETMRRWTFFVPKSFSEFWGASTYLWNLFLRSN